MRRRKRLPSQLAADLGISHATVRRWLFGEDIPSVRSCQLLADYSGISLQKVLKITGQLPEMAIKEARIGRSSASMLKKSIRIYWMKI